MQTNLYAKNVFINCPFDEEFATLLRSMLFRVVRLGFSPRLASESSDSGQNRLDKIVKIIRQSKYSIHDLSRCQACASGEYLRMNMPFELGIDYGCRNSGNEYLAEKKFLVLDEIPHRLKAALSDMSGCDYEAHEANHQIVVQCVRNWLVSEANAPQVGAARILDDYEDFQAWYIDAKIDAGGTRDAISRYPTSELLEGMLKWCAINRAITPY